MIVLLNIFYLAFSQGSIWCFSLFSIPHSYKKHCVRIRNNIQDSQQCSLPPYHLTCKVAEIVLFTINPTTLSTTKLFNYFLTTLSPNSAQPFNILPISFQHVFAGRAEDDARRGKTKEGGFRESPTGERKTTER